MCVCVCRCICFILVRVQYSISVVHSLDFSMLNAQLDHFKCAVTQFCSTEAHLIPRSVYGIQNDINKKQKHRDKDIKIVSIIMYYYYGLWVMGYGIWIKWCIIILLLLDILNKRQIHVIKYIVHKRLECSKWLSYPEYLPIT